MLTCESEPPEPSSGYAGYESVDFYVPDLHLSIELTKEQIAKVKNSIAKKYGE
jgi:hypothetical protein